MSAATTLPRLIIVGGPPGSGKTQLAHAIAAAIHCPAISRDEIKEGMVATAKEFEPAPGDPLTVRTFSVFFEVLRALLEAGTTVVAEAAFQDRVWRQGLGTLLPLAELRVIHCVADPAVARERITRRLAENGASRAAHADAEFLRTAGERRHFERLSIDVPTLSVDTTDGYDPPLADVIAFVSAML